MGRIGVQEDLGDAVEHRRRVGRVIFQYAVGRWATSAAGQSHGRAGGLQAGCDVLGDLAARAEDQDSHGVAPNM